MLSNEKHPNFWKKIKNLKKYKKLEIKVKQKNIRITKIIFSFLKTKRLTNFYLYFFEDWNFNFFERYGKILSKMFLTCVLSFEKK